MPYLHRGVRVVVFVVSSGEVCRSRHQQRRARIGRPHGLSLRQPSLREGRVGVRLSADVALVCEVAPHRVPSIGRLDLCEHLDQRCVLMQALDEQLRVRVQGAAGLLRLDGRVARIQPSEDAAKMPPSKVLLLPNRSWQGTLLSPLLQSGHARHTRTPKRWRYAMATSTRNPSTAASGSRAKFACR